MKEQLKSKSTVMLTTGDMLPATIQQKDKSRCDELIQAGKFDIERYEQACAQNWNMTFMTLPAINIQQAIKLNTPSLATIRKYKGDEKAFKTLIKIIETANDFFNIKYKMNQPQIFITSKLIFANYYHLNIADLQVCFMNAFAGHYGEMYHSIDGAVICEWLKKYQNSKHEIAQYQAQKKSDEFKSTKIPAAADKEGIKKMVQIYRDALSSSSVVKTPKTIFRSVEHFVTLKGGDMSKVLPHLEKYVDSRYDNHVASVFPEKETFMKHCLNEITASLNRGNKLKDILNSTT